MLSMAMGVTWPIIVLKAKLEHIVSNGWNQK